MFYWHCVRCEGPITEDQPRKPARARGRQPNSQKELGLRHASCPREAIVAKQERDNERNRQQQLRDGARVRSHPERLEPDPPGPASNAWRWRTSDDRDYPVRTSQRSQKQLSS